MAAYMVVLLNCRNTDWLTDYVTNVPAIFRRYGGEYVTVSQDVKKLEGTIPAPQQVAIFSFPTRSAVEDFMKSEAYKPFKDARMRNSDAEIFIFEGINPAAA